jgi:Aminotransferase class I and II
MQPWDGCPGISDGSFVPWMPTTPPSGQSHLDVRQRGRAERHRPVDAAGREPGQAITDVELAVWGRRAGRRRYEDGWAHDFDALERSLRGNTRLLYINQPHNPTGTLMDRATFEPVAELARSHGLVLFADEVYRELEHLRPCGRASC